MLNVKIHAMGDQFLPRKAHPDDACFDLFSRDFIAAIGPGEVRKVHLGFSLEIPNGWEAQIRPRSGLSLKGIWCPVGTIDAGYRGELAAILFNTTQESFSVTRGMKVAQLSFSKVLGVQWEQVSTLAESARGAGGFGSTGLSDLNSGTDS